MRGMIFRFFADFAEEHFPVEIMDEALELDALTVSRGAYTTVGDYPPEEFLAIATHVSDRTGLPVPELVRRFGAALFVRLASAHSGMVAQFDGCFDMLAGIETVIHRNVRKLYDTSALPAFDVLEHDGDRLLVLHYQSSRPFADLAEGLIDGALHHFGDQENVDVRREDLSDDGMNAVFRLNRHEHDARRG